MSDLLASLSFNKGSTVRPAEKRQRCRAKKTERLSARDEWHEQSSRQSKENSSQTTKGLGAYYSVSGADKDDPLLTPLHFNCRNKKIVLVLGVFFWKRGGRQWAVTGKTPISWGGHDAMSKWKPLSQAVSAICGVCETATSALSNPCKLSEVINANPW